MRLDSYPRMADFGRVLAAVDRVLDTTGLDTYLGSRAELAEDAVSADPVLTALTTRLAKGHPDGWQGISAELLERITPADPEWKRPRTGPPPGSSPWPSAATPRHCVGSAGP
ncbi:MAG: hypothetical protein ACRDT0_21750 [Pseudonocardiaceae bacterium]